MAIKVKNTTKQTIPVVIPSKEGGEEVRIGPGKTVILGVDKLTNQLRSLVNKGKLKIRK